MTSWRLQVLGVSALCVVGGAFLAWEGQKDLKYLARGLGNHRAVITSQHYAVAALFLAAMSLAIGIMFMFAKQATYEEQRNITTKQFNRGRAFLVFIAVCLVAASLAPTVQFWTVETMALNRGYVHCPTPDQPRHQPDRWALPGAHSRTEHCPGEGADPKI